MEVLETVCQRIAGETGPAIFPVRWGEEVTLSVVMVGRMNASPMCDQDFTGNRSSVRTMQV